MSDLLVWFQLATSLMIFAVVVWLLVFMLRGAPFVPSHPKAVLQMISLAKVQSGEKAADLGSGDGRLVIALARSGAEAHGFEVNPLLVWWSRRKIREAGLLGRAFIHRQSFWRADLSSHTIVTVFGITHIMPRLERKLLRELPAGARVVSNGFPFPKWLGEEKSPGIYVYSLCANSSRCDE